VIKSLDFKQLRQEILIEERDLFELTNYFEELVQCSTPGEDGFETTREDFNKCEICLD
jgi:hypothetical protein